MDKDMVDERRDKETSREFEGKKLLILGGKI